MTKLFRIILFMSSTVIIFSLLSLAILYKLPKTADKIVGGRINSNIRVAVMNGCGREGLASIFAQKLRNIGYDVVNGQGENADSFDFNISVILNRKGNKNYAKTLAKDLGIREILDQYSANPYIIEDLVVIIGRDWDTLNISKETMTIGIK